MLDKIQAEIKDFLNIPFNKYLALALLILGVILIFIPEPTANNGFSQSENGSIVIHFFYSPTCHICDAQKVYNQELMNEFPEINFIYHDVQIPGEYVILQTMLQNHSEGLSTIGVPTTIIKDKVFVGFLDANTSGARMRDYIMECINATCTIPQNESESKFNGDVLKHINIPIFGEIDLSSYSLPMLAIVLGLIDGFNPCAMWVLVYLIALVLELKDRSKIWLIVGTFVFASGILYFLFMTAWLNAFLLLGYVRIVTIIVGLFALGAGILSVKELIETRGQVVCKVGDAEEKKKLTDNMKELISSPLTIATFFGIVVLAFVINSIEFVCSAALPAIFTHVLSLKSLSTLEYYAYILIYDFFFMLDDLIIFGIAAFMVTGTVGEKYASYCKIIGGTVLLILGLLLLFAPNMLA
ncbi:hypothetical protein KJ780_01975 [Candidatus Micrarchaeota archaeon]|nr:hypothetical protein [Candidatus Micrarchaeota archaeon]